GALRDRRVLGIVLAVTPAVVAVYFGFFFVPAAYPGTQSTIAVAVTVVAVVAVCMRDGAARRRCLALLALATGALAIIALGRANLYEAGHFSTQTVVSQLRYYYAALAPLAVVACLVIDRARRALRVPGAALLAVWLAVAGFTFARSSWRMDERESFRNYSEGTCRSIDAAIDGAPPAADVRIPNRRVIPNCSGPSTYWSTSRDGSASSSF